LQDLACLQETKVFPFKRWIPGLLQKTHFLSLCLCLSSSFLAEPGILHWVSYNIMCLFHLYATPPPCPTGFIITSTNILLLLLLQLNPDLISSLSKCFEDLESPKERIFWPQPKSSKHPSARESMDPLGGVGGIRLEIGYGRNWNKERSKSKP
jgi:hypothetical protein